MQEVQYVAQKKTNLTEFEYGTIVCTQLFITVTLTTWQSYVIRWYNNE